MKVSPVLVEMNIGQGFRCVGAAHRRRVQGWSHPRKHDLYNSRGADRNDRTCFAHHSS